MFGFLKKKPPKDKDITPVNTYYMRYDGKKGYAQVAGKVTTKFVAIWVNNPNGKVNRIMKVSNREYFSDFGGTCTQFDIEATDFDLS